MEICYMYSAVRSIIIVWVGFLSFFEGICLHIPFRVARVNEEDLRLCRLGPDR
jgi:hypothetical protein